MTNVRRVTCLVLAIGLASTPALAQQSGHAAARRFGAALAVAGGTAIVLGATALKTGSSTSGNLPNGMYDTCVAMKANPVYKNNDCGILKGPNTAVVIGGTIAAALGTSLVMWSTAKNIVQAGPAGVSYRYRLVF